MSTSEHVSGKKILKDFLDEVGFLSDFLDKQEIALDPVYVKNRLDMLNQEVATVANIVIRDNPAKTTLAAMRGSTHSNNDDLYIIQLVEFAVDDCFDDQTKQV
jgi:hypothetical protein